MKGLEKIIAIIVPFIALGVSVWSLANSCQANKTSKVALELSKIVNTPFLDARLEKFKSGTYYKVEKNDKGIFVNIQFELTNTGNVPVTVSSADFLKLEVESQKIPYPKHEAPTNIILAPKTSKFYKPLFGLSAERKSDDELFERANSDNFNLLVEFKFVYHSDLNENDNKQIVVGYKLTKEKAEITKNIK